MPVVRRESWRQCLVWVTVLVSVIVSCAPASREDRHTEEDYRTVGGPQTVSLVRLISSPKLFHGKAIRVKGFGVIQSGYMALKLSREDANYLVTTNGIWLDLSPDQFRKYEKFSDRYIVVEGVFEPPKRGYYGSAGGSLKRVLTLEPLPSRDELEGSEKEASK